MMKRMMCVLCVVMLSLGARAHGQDDVRAILDASREAIANTEGFTAQFRMFGEGSAAIKTMLPNC